MAAKLKDGLFLGDADSSADAEFLDLNKISNLVNLAGREIPNKWATHGALPLLLCICVIIDNVALCPASLLCGSGFVYHSINWQDHADCTLFDPSLDVLMELIHFIDHALR